MMFGKFIQKGCAEKKLNHLNFARWKCLCLFLLVNMQHLSYFFILERC